MLSMQGKVALVTGFGSVDVDGWSTGAAQAALLAQRGAIVYGVDRLAEPAERMRQVIESEGGQCHAAIADVTQPEAAADLIADCVARFGKIDVLVNNVGRSAPGDVVTTTDEVWAEQLDINLTSTFRMCRAAIPEMEKHGGGAIVNVSSVSGMRYTGKPQIGYATSKSALIHFTRMAAVMHAKSGVRLNCVIPGLIDTPLVRRLADQFGGGRYEEYVAARAARVPLGVVGNAWDIANASLFLASDEARYITGIEIVVDGGVTATMS